MAHAWKACWVQALGGSNPPSSAVRCLMTSWTPVPPVCWGFGFLFFGLVVAFGVDFVFAEDGSLMVENGDFAVFH